MGVAVGWGGLQRRDALYIPVTPEKNDGDRTSSAYRPRKEIPEGRWKFPEAVPVE